MTQKQILVSYEGVLAMKLVEGAPTFEQGIVWWTLIEHDISTTEDWSGTARVTDKGYLVTVETGYTEEEEQWVRERKARVGRQKKQACAAQTLFGFLRGLPRGRWGRS